MERYDICESCNYLELVAVDYMMDDGSRVVPLCSGCAADMGVGHA